MFDTLQIKAQRAAQQQEVLHDVTLVTQVGWSLFSQSPGSAVPVPLPACYQHGFRPPPLSSLAHFALLHANPHLLQATLDRAENAARLCRVWAGPIVAVFAVNAKRDDGANARDLLRNQLLQSCSNAKVQVQPVRTCN